MKAIIKNGVANKDIQSCLISECGVEITFHNNDLADKFALSLNLSGIPCVNNGNKITISYIDQLQVVMWRSWSQAHDYNTCLQYLQSCKMSIVGHRG